MGWHSLYRTHNYVFLCVIVVLGAAYICIFQVYCIILSQCSHKSVNTRGSCLVSCNDEMLLMIFSQSLYHADESSLKEFKVITAFFKTFCIPVGQFPC